MRAAAPLAHLAPLAPPAPLTRSGGVLCLLYALHALSPYLGVEVQHSGAMLSNLRVDPSCHNSLIFPAWGWDPYVYIDEASLGAAHRPRRVEALRAQLWSVTAVRAMRESWCAPHTRPLRLAGRWGGRAFVI